jgi:hypothetical protein
VTEDFKAPLRLRSDVDLSALPKIEEYGMQLVQVAEQILSPRISGILRDWQDTHA